MHFSPGTAPENILSGPHTFYQSESPLTVAAQAEDKLEARRLLKYGADADSANLMSCLPRAAKHIEAAFAMSTEPLWSVAGLVAR